MHTQNDHVTKVEGMPGFFTNDGTICPKAAAAPNVLYAPDRILFPMRRVGQRGEGKWERISWDQALNTIAANLKEVKEKHGPQAYFHLLSAMALGSDVSH